MKRVLVLNHFAVPLGASGGTRHTELFSRLRGWSHLIVNASTSAPQSSQVTRASGFLSAWATPFAGNGPARILNWATYAASATFRLAPGQRPDVVYASSPHLLAGLSGYLLAQRWRVPLVLEIRDLWPKVLVDMDQLSADSPVYRALVQLELFLYDKADAIVVMAQGTADDLVARGINAEKLTLIPNGADPSDFDVESPREGLRDRYGFTRTTAVYVGAHGPANGLDLLLDAADALSGDDVDIVLIGEGVDKSRLVTEVASRALTNVRFHEPIPKSEVPELLAAADIGLHVLADVPLFRYGISPNKVFDYLAAGKPVLTNVPGEIGELVVRSGGGIVVEPTGIALGIRALTGLSPEERESMGDRGRAFMELHQSRSSMARLLQELLDATV